jgi:hypothetical protein
VTKRCNPAREGNRRGGGWRFKGEIGRFELLESAVALGFDYGKADKGSQAGVGEGYIDKPW